MTFPNLEQTAAEISTLPDLPENIRQLLGYLNDESVELKIIVRAIECDLALAAGVMRVANSPFYGMSKQVNNVMDAVVVLGFSTLRMIFVASMMASTQFPGLEDVAEVRIQYRHALATALFATWIGKRNQIDTSSLFLAGILHDIGSLALTSKYPQHYEEVRQLAVRDDLFMHEAERQLLGFDHADVGAALCRHWNLPEDIVLAIASHHKVGESANGASLLDRRILTSSVVFLADACAHAMNIEGDPRAMVPSIPEPLWNQWIGPQASLNDMLKEVNSVFQELVGLLKP